MVEHLAHQLLVLDLSRHGARRPANRAPSINDLDTQPARVNSDGLCDHCEVTIELDEWLPRLQPPAQGEGLVEPSLSTKLDRISSADFCPALGKLPRQPVFFLADTTRRTCHDAKSNHTHESRPAHCQKLFLQEGKRL